MYMYIYTRTHTHTHTHNIYIYIYIYIIYIYIYIYIGDNEVYVLPAFQLQPSKGGRIVPNTKDELLAMGEKVSLVHLCARERERARERARGGGGRERVYNT
jgi:hypothetical protein